jgi:type IV pilus assembly protein PilA
MNKQRIALIVASVIGMLAVFMPWITIPFNNKLNGLNVGEGNVGYFALLFFAVSLLIALIGDKTKLLVTKTKYIAASAGLISVTIVGSYIISFQKKVGDIGNAGAPCELNALGNAFGMGNAFSKMTQGVTQAVAASVSIEFGVFLLIISGIAVYLISLFAKWFSNESDTKNNISKPFLIASLVFLAVALIVWPEATSMSPKAKAQEIPAAAGTWLKLQDAYSMENDRFGSNDEIGYTPPQSNYFCYVSGIISRNEAVWKATARGSIGDCTDGVWIIIKNKTNVETQIKGTNCAELTPSFKNLK